MQEELVGRRGIDDVDLDNAIVRYGGPSARHDEGPSEMFDDVGSSEHDGEPGICSSHEMHGIAAFFRSGPDTVRATGEAGGEEFPFVRVLRWCCGDAGDGIEEKK